MSSPSIDLDLDMSLLNSPVPPTRDGHIQVSRDDNGDVGLQVSSIVGNGFVNNNMSGSNTNPSLEHGMITDNCSYPSNATTSVTTQRNHVENNTSIDYGTAKRTSNDLAEPNSTNGKRKQDYDETTRIVEAWREELYMMNVKNAILKDDLVGLGADA